MTNIGSFGRGPPEKPTKIYRPQHISLTVITNV